MHLDFACLPIPMLPFRSPDRLDAGFVGNSVLIEALFGFLRAFTRRQTLEVRVTLAIDPLAYLIIPPSCLLPLSSSTYLHCRSCQRALEVLPLLLGTTPFLAESLEPICQLDLERLLNRIVPQLLHVDVDMRLPHASL